jgi:hypothetical protein
VEDSVAVLSSGALSVVDEPSAAGLGSSAAVPLSEESVAVPVPSEVLSSEPLLEPVPADEPAVPSEEPVEPDGVYVLVEPSPVEPAPSPAVDPAPSPAAPEPSGEEPDVPALEPGDVEALEPEPPDAAPELVDPVGDVAEEVEPSPPTDPEPAEYEDDPLLLEYVELLWAPEPEEPEVPPLVTAGA